MRVKRRKPRDAVDALVDRTLSEGLRKGWLKRWRGRDGDWCYALTPAGEANFHQMRGMFSR